MNSPKSTDSYAPISMAIAAATITSRRLSKMHGEATPKGMLADEGLPVDENGQFVGGRPRSIDRHDSQLRRVNKKRRARKGW